MAWKDFFFGRPEKFSQQSLLSPQQMPLQQQYMQSAMNPGAGGAFGDAADYYRSLLSDDPSTLQAMIAPEQRRFQQETIPGLAEQFAGMGAGNLSSSGFRNAAVGAGTDLAERIASMRANLRQQGAQGLLNIGQGALNPYMQNIHRPAQQSPFLKLLGSTAASFGSPALAGIGEGFGNTIGNWMANKDTPASPQI